MTYREAKNLIQSKYEDGYYIRNLFIHLQQRFELEYFDEVVWKAKFVEFLDRYDNFMDCVYKNDSDSILENILKEEEALDYIKRDNRDFEAIDRKWSSHPTEFITLLHNYRSISDPNLAKKLVEFSSSINNDSLRFIYEIIQNADDCEYATNEKPAIRIELLSESKMKISYNEKGMTYADILSLTTIDQSNKTDRITKKLIGEKGIGFKTIFSVCKSVSIHSSNYHFQLDDRSFTPKEIACDDYSDGTTLILSFNAKQKLYDDSFYNKLMNKYGYKFIIGGIMLDHQDAFKNCPILFTNKLDKITIINEKNNSFSIFRTGDLTLHYTYSGIDNFDYQIECQTISKNIQFTNQEYNSRYPNQFKGEEFELLPDKSPITYEIKLIAPLDTTLIKEGNVYSFLPTFTNINAPFNIQLPVQLNLDRSSISFEINNTMILWNKRIFDEAFFNDDSLIVEFFDQINNKFDYIPNFTSEEEESLFITPDKTYAQNVEKLNNYCGHKLYDVFYNINYFKEYENDNYVSINEAIMFDEFIHKNCYKDFYLALLSKYMINYDNPVFVEYEPLAIEKAGKAFDFNYLKLNDEVNIYCINYVLMNENPKLQGLEKVIRQEFGKKDNRSIYIPKSIENLKVLPYKSFDLNSYNYKSYNEGKFWFNYDLHLQDIFNDGEICFLATEIDNIGLKFIDFKKNDFKEVNNLYEIVANIWEKLWKSIYKNNGNEFEWDCEFPLFEEILRLFSRILKISEGDYYKLCKDILVGSNFNLTKFNKNIRKNFSSLLYHKKNDFVSECLLEDQLELYKLCILASKNISRSEINNESFNLLVLENWDAELCTILNDPKKKVLDCFNLDTDLNKYEVLDDERIEPLKELRGDNVLILVFSELPVEHVCFGEYIILKSTDNLCISNCLNFLKPGYNSFLKSKEIKKRILLKGDKIFKSKNEAASVCNDIQNICALQSYFNVDKKRAIIGSDNNILDELLQNANDRITNGEITIRCNSNLLVLEYIESGFTAKDFLAVSTIGNSGHTNDGKVVDNYNDSIGYKGTGFKSVYNLFDKVTIQNGYVTCILDDTKDIDLAIDSKEEIKVIYRKWQCDKKVFPVPEFKYSDLEEKKTIITLRVAKQHQEKYIKNVLQEVKNFRKTKVYYFLDNIAVFKINKIPFYKETIIKKDFYIENEEIEIPNDELLNNPKYEDFTKGKNRNLVKNSLKILFPKKIDMANKFMESNSLFCTLPVRKELLQTSFLVNCPLFELEEGRNSISENPQIKRWNDYIREITFINKNSLFEKLFSRFAQNNPLIAPSYFPFELLYRWSSIFNIPFIRTIKDSNKEYKLMSLNELELSNDFIYESGENNKFVFLPNCMYEWFRFKQGLDGFTSIKPFVYIDYSYDYKKLFENICSHVYEYEEDYGLIKSNFLKLDNFYILNNILQYFKNKFYINRSTVLKDNIYLYRITQLKKELSNLVSEDYWKNKITLVCYQCFLGSKICNKRMLDIHDITIDGYGSLDEYRKKINECFGEINEDIFMECFLNIRQSLYLVDGSIVSPDDEVLNLVFKKYSTQLEKIYFCISDLEIDGIDIEERKSLFESGKIVLKDGDGKFFTSDDPRLSSSFFIDNGPYIVSRPKWCIEYLENADDRILTNKFYETLDIDNIKKILEQYFCKSKEFDRKDELFNAIINYLTSAIELDSRKNKELFEFVFLKANENDEICHLLWKSNLLDLGLVEVYNDIAFSKYGNQIDPKRDSYLRFIFPSNKLAEVNQNLINKFITMVPLIKRNEEFRFMREFYTLDEIFNNKIRVFNRSKGNEQHYCIGKIEGEKGLYIIVFGEKSISKALRELFDCNDYKAINGYTEMNNFLPNPLFKTKYDNCDLNIFNGVSIPFFDEDLKNDALLKRYLIQRFEFYNKFEKKWMCFKGYGDSSYSQKKCPICGGILIAESSSLNVKKIEVTEGIYVPILLCNNCNLATGYAANVYFSKNKQKYKSTKDFIVDIRQSDKMQICFEMEYHEKKYFNLNMVVLHRLLCIQLLSLDKQK